MPDTDVFTRRRARARRFLDALYAGADTEANVVLFVLPWAKALQLPVADLEVVAHEAVQISLEEGTHVYFGCCPMRPFGDGRGKADDALILPGLWADLDIAGEAHKSNALPPSREAALALLDEMPAPPTVVVDSGHGLQVWWLFDRPRTLRHDEARLFARGLLEACQGRLRALAAVHGWTVDPTADLARVLRLPGTVNRKLPGEPRPVEITAGSGRRYTPTELVNIFGPVSPVPAKVAAPLPEAIPAGQRTKSIESLAGTLRRRNVAQEAALAAALEHNRLVCSPPLPESKVRETVEGIYKRYAPATGLTPAPTAPRERHGRWIIEGDALESLEVVRVDTLPVLGVDGFVMRQAANLLYSYPKAGKTELLTALLTEWVEGGASVLYLTEEPLHFWKLRLEGRRTWPFWRPVTFASAFGWTIGDVLAVIEERPKDIVVVDTLRNAVGYGEHKGDEDVSRVILPLIQAVRDQNGTLVASYHARKMPGEGGQDISGHHSLYGAFDRAIQLKTVPGEDNDRKRRLLVSGRMLDPGSPQRLVYEMDEYGRLNVTEGRAEASVRPCEYCNAPFTPQRSTARFCSDLCRVRHGRGVEG